MEGILSWLKEYSPPVVLLLLVGSAVLFVLRLTVEKSIATSFEAHAKKLELRLARRSTFEEKVLADRYALVTDLSARLQKVMTNLNRMRSGQPVPEGFMKQKEIVPLTEIFEDLETHRLALTEEFYQLFQGNAQLVLKAANARNPQEWDDIAKEWLRLGEEIRSAAENTFRIREIRW